MTAGYAPLVRRPILQPQFRFAIAPSEGVALLSPAGDVLLEGDIYERLVPLLDGRRSADGIVDALGASHDPAEVFQALGRLQAGGYVTNARRARSVRAEQKLSGRYASQRAAVVQLFTVGMDRRPIHRALQTAGWRVSTRTRAWLVIADDCLTPELVALEAAAKSAGRPWLLAVPHPLAPTVGPLFVPGDGACLRCLTERVARNRPIESYLRLRGVQPRRPEQPPASDATTMRRVLQRAALWFATPGRARDQVDAWDPTTRTWLSHALARRPQCASCGDANAYGRTATLPLDVARGAALCTSLVARTDLVDPITGVVSDLRPHPVPQIPALHICVATTGSVRGRGRLEDVLHDLKLQPSGRGSTPHEAAAGAIGEAVERYSGVWQGDEPRTRTTLNVLRSRGMHPNEVLCFSDTQFRDRKRLNRDAPLSTRIPAAFDPSVRIDWTPVRSLLNDRERWLPSSLLYYGHPDSTSPAFCYADSNGCAAGTTPATALRSALLELIERDAVAVWWYNRLRRPRVDIAAAHDPWCDAIVDSLRSLGRAVWALDLTSDLEVATFAVVSRRLAGPRQAILLGFGADPDPRVALRRACGEMGQMFAATVDFENADASLPADMREWLARGSLSRHPYLVPLSSQSRRLDESSTAAHSEPKAQHILELLERRGYEVFALDQTRPDIGVPVVRAIVPGLRHFWPRFGPGRLFDVPAQLGWLRRTRSEAQLNPTACFL